MDTFVLTTNKDELGKQDWTNEIANARAVREGDQAAKDAYRQAQDAQQNEENAQQNAQLSAYQNHYKERLDFSKELMTSRYNEGDGRKMNRVKVALNRLNNSLADEIPEDQRVFREKVKQVVKEYDEVIAACDWYLNNHRGLRITGTGRTRKRLVKRLKNMALTERIAVRDAEQAQYIFNNRVEGAVMGNILGRSLYVSDEFEVKDMQLSGGKYKKQVRDPLNEAKSNDYELNKKHGVIREEDKKAVGVSRLYSYLGVGKLTEETGLAVAKGKDEKLHFGVRKKGAYEKDGDEADKTFAELSGQLQGDAKIYYSDVAIRQLNVIKFLNILMGTSGFDEKQDILLSYTKRQYGDKVVYHVSGAYQKSMPKSFDANVTGDMLRQGHNGEAPLTADTIPLCPPEFMRQISQMDVTDVDYLFGDLLPESGREAFKSRLAVMKEAIEGLQNRQEQDIGVYRTFFNENAVAERNVTENRMNDIEKKHQRLYQGIMNRILSVPTVSERVNILCEYTAILTQPSFQQLPEEEKSVIKNVLSRVVAEGVSEDMIFECYRQKQQSAEALVNSRNAATPEDRIEKEYQKSGQEGNTDPKYLLREKKEYATFTLLRNQPETVLSYQKYDSLLEFLKGVKNKTLSYALRNPVRVMW